MRWPCRSGAIALAFASAACSGVTEPPSSRPRLSLALEGRVERGSSATLSILADNVPITPVAPTITVDPANAATVTGRSLALLRAGPFTVTVVVDADTATLSGSVAVPPVIYLDAVAAGNRDIYSVALDGGDLVRVTTSPADDATPSAARGTVVFVSQRDGNAELYSVPVTGGTDHRITSTSTVSERLPALSADGRAVAFVKDSAGFTRVWRSADLGVTAVALTPTGTGSASLLESSPMWSPAMDRVVFASTATPSGNSGVFVASAAGGTPVLVPGSGALGAEVEPAVSPEGTRAVVVSSRAGANGLYVRDLSSGAVTTLYESSGALGQPGWLADGRIVFVRFTLTGSTLAWLDPSAPLVVHDVVASTVTNPQHPTPYRP